MIESDLVKRLQKGEEEAFRELVGDVYHEVVKIATGFLHNRADAEDIAQDVMVEVYRSIRKFRGDASLTTWIYRIAVNKSLNAIRKTKRQNLHADVIEISDKAVEHNPNQETQTENEERAKVLHKALDALPKNQRMAFVLAKYEDMSYQQIAAVMETSLSSIESLMHRAKKNLQKKLLNYYKKNVY
ncbi:MAG: RNA polymerase sigma factor [Bacteroidales bacterium]|nr:RNA polymerase sigma factor [Bacteroidales bacterium]MCF8343418.1 RNA polymerase sigma factor [Bacteroidales bacterium]MCF8349858.1 RNA polymerase sigma factor [Bacteroidales bacterium]MCF8375546.1 RNA polymerase sigma factor [Bacteroidales bacterium]MCF8399945.1 RNA polymerase sigma factor [Bacteroidales bacterium]